MRFIYKKRTFSQAPNLLESNEFYLNIKKIMYFFYKLKNLTISKEEFTFAFDIMVNIFNILSCCMLVLSFDFLKFSLDIH